MKQCFYKTGIACLAVLVLQLGQAIGQLQHLRKLADKSYESGDYNAAVYQYLAWLQQEGSRVPYQVTTIAHTGEKNSKYLPAVFHLAESYRRLNNFTEAAAHYNTVLETAAADYPLARYWYAVCMRATGNYTQAEKQFQLFVSDYRHMDEYKRKALLEAENCRFSRQAVSNADSACLTITRLQAPVNNATTSYAAVWVADSLMLFTSTRHAGGKKQEHVPYVNKLYHYSAADTTGIHMLELGLPAGVHQGAGSVSADGNTLYFTGWQQTGNTRQTTIYYSRQKEGKWEPAVKMEAPVNVAGSNSIDPFITPDGQWLFISSDRKGGKGGWDLWAVPLQQGVPTQVKAINMGDQINTPGDERSPYYYTDSSILVFASNGRPGMGGFDLYTATGTIQQWQPPVNMGYPVNSFKDELYFFNTQHKGWLQQSLISSDRASVCCLEVFTVNRQQPEGPVKAAAPPVIEHPVVAIDTPLTATVPQQDETITLPVADTVYFNYDVYDLTAAARVQLNRLAAWWKEGGISAVTIAGYTDTHGSGRYNYRLGLNRASACMRYLVADGVPEKYIQITSYGKESSIAGGAEAADRKVIIRWKRK